MWHPEIRMKNWNLLLRLHLFLNIVIDCIKTCNYRADRCWHLEKSFNSRSLTKCGCVQNLWNGLLSLIKDFILTFCMFVWKSFIKFSFLKFVFTYLILYHSYIQSPTACSTTVTLRRTDCLNWQNCVIDRLVCFTVKLLNTISRMSDSIDITRKAWKFLVHEKLAQYWFALWLIFILLAALPHLER